jgi:hypothetical protein
MFISLLTAIIICLLFGCIDAYIEVSTPTRHTGFLKDVPEEEPLEDVLDPVKILPSPLVSLSKLTPVHAKDFTPSLTIRVDGLSDGSMVTIYRDSQCTIPVITATARGDTLEITIENLDHGVHQYFGTQRQKDHTVSPCSTTSASYERAECPNNFLQIGGNATFNTQPFCIMKYEAKALKVDTQILKPDGRSGSTANWATIYHPTDATDGYIPVSTADAQPWTRITQGKAKEACQALGSQYHLPNNAEWMSVAREIESIGSNWSNGSVADGAINRGNSSNTPPASCAAHLENIITDCETVSTDFALKRTHTLATGAIIWDFAGNVWDMVDWYIPPEQKAYISTDAGPVMSWRSYADLSLLGVNIADGDVMAKKEWQASNPAWSHTQGLGRYYSGDAVSGGGPLRGGAFNDGVSSGIYALFIRYALTFTYHNTGFRCVYRP